MRKIAQIAGIALVGSMMVAATAQAVPITGEINFTGTMTLNGPYATATAVAFANSAVLPATVNPLTGDYAVLPELTKATFTSFTFDPLPGTGVVPLWTLTYSGKTYSFDLTSIATITRGTTDFALAGSGILHITGREDTVGDWFFSTQGGNATASFSATNVPEPATMLLLGTGLLGLVGATRRRKVS